MAVLGSKLLLLKPNAQEALDEMVRGGGGAANRPHWDSLSALAKTCNRAMRSDGLPSSSACMLLAALGRQPGTHAASCT